MAPRKLEVEIDEVERLIRSIDIARARPEYLSDLRELLARLYARRDEQRKNASDRRARMRQVMIESNHALAKHALSPPTASNAAATTTTVDRGAETSCHTIRRHRQELLREVERLAGHLQTLQEIAQHYETERDLREEARSECERKRRSCHAKLAQAILPPSKPASPKKKKRRSLMSRLSGTR